MIQAIYQFLRKSIPFGVKDNIRQTIQRISPAFFVKLNGIITTRLKHLAPIVIFQMGKVGSTSIARSIDSQLPNIIYKHHLILPKHIDQAHAVHVQAGLPTRNQMEHLEAKWLYSNIIQKKLPLKIITITREPIARELSENFENFEIIFSVPYSAWDGNIDTLKSQLITKAKQAAEANISETGRWFDEIFKPTLGIDIYDYPFPKEKGHLRIQHENIDLLIIRIEIPDADKEAAISEFLDCPGFKLINTNVGDQKDYAATYKEVRDTIVFPQEYLDLAYNSKYTRHFYTDEDIAKFRAKWER